MTKFSFDLEEHEREALDRYRADHGLRSLAQALKHMLGRLHLGDVVVVLSPLASAVSATGVEIHTHAGQPVNANKPVATFTPETVEKKMGSVGALAASGYRFQLGPAFPAPRPKQGKKK